MDHYKAVILTGITGILGIVGLWVGNRVLGKAAFQTAMNQGFLGLLSEVRAEKAELIQLLETERGRFDEERTLWRAERVQLQGEVRQLQQTMESMRKVDGESRNY